MNIKELEHLLRKIEQVTPYDYTYHHDIVRAILWCQAQQRRQAKRKLEFKLKAAEQRELLR